MLWRGFGRPWMGYREMDRVRDEMNRVIDGLQRRVAPTYPALNAWTGEDKLVVSAELPGVDPEELDISVKNQVLTMRGSRKLKDEDGQYHRRERSGGGFTRTLDLPYRVDAEKVEARMENGVLFVALPRAEEDKPRKIEVKSS